MTTAQERKDIARRLRREATVVERRLSYRLRRSQLGVRFRRQHPVGPYIVDFVCLPHRLSVELDGGQHLARRTPHALPGGPVLNLLQKR